MLGSRFKKRLFTSSYIVGSLAFILPAFAQSSDIDEIIVTARKRDETLLEIPVAVTAFSQERLDKLGINTLDGLSAFTPGFDFNANNRVTPQIRFRGLGAVTDTAASRTGAVFWEGSYISDGISILPLIDLDRVEVIKGPQTAFFGRNTFSGAVNFIPKEPGDVLEGKGSVSFSPSNQDSKNVTVAVGGPVTEKFGARVAGMVERVGADWFYRNGDPNGDVNTIAGTVNFVFKPSDSLKLKANGFYVRSDDTIAQQSQSADTLAGQCNRTYSGSLRNVATGAPAGTFSTNLANANRAITCRAVSDFDTRPPSMSVGGRFDRNPQIFPLSVSVQQATTLPVEFERHGSLNAPKGLGGEYELSRLNLSADYELANGGSLNGLVSRGSVGNWYITDNQFGFPSPTLGPGLFLVGFIRWTRDTFMEARYSSSADGKLRYMIGASYYDQDLEASSLAARKILSNEAGKNVGVFGSIDYDLTEQLTLSLEGRWNEDTQTIVFNGVTQRTPTDPAAIVDVDQTFNAFMPRAIISYKPSSDTNIYASFSRSNIQGISTNADAYGRAVPASGISTATVGFFTPKQSLDAYEIGAKQQPTSWLQYAIAAYHFDWKNQVFADLSPAFIPVNLPGDSRTYGVELEATLNPTDWLQLTTGATYNDVKFTKFGSAGSIANGVLAPGLVTAGLQIDAAGNRPRWIPSWTGSMSAEVQLGDLLGYEPGAFVRLDGNYTGNFFVDNFQFNSVDGYWKFNLRAGANVTDNFAVEIYGNNITNNLSWTTGSGSDTTTVGTLDRKTFATLPRKREVGVKFLASF